MHFHTFLLNTCLAVSCCNRYAIKTYRARNQRYMERQESVWKWKHKTRPERKCLKSKIITKCNLSKCCTCQGCSNPLNLNLYQHELIKVKPITIEAIQH